MEVIQDLIQERQTVIQDLNDSLSSIKMSDEMQKIKQQEKLRQIKENDILSFLNQFFCLDIEYIKHFFQISIQIMKIIDNKFEYKSTIKGLVNEITELFLVFFQRINHKSFVQEIQNIIYNRYQESHLFKMYVTKLINYSRCCLQTLINSTKVVQNPASRSNFYNQQYVNTTYLETKRQTQTQFLQTQPKLSFKRNQSQLSPIPGKIRAKKTSDEVKEPINKNIFSCPVEDYLRHFQIYFGLIPVDLNAFRDNLYTIKYRGEKFDFLRFMKQKNVLINQSLNQFQKNYELKHPKTKRSLKEQRVLGEVSRSMENSLINKPITHQMAMTMYTIKRPKKKLSLFSLEKKTGLVFADSLSTKSTFPKFQQNLRMQY